MTFTVGSSSVNKGESLRDTIETVAAMGVDAFVIRHRSSGVPWQVSRLDDREHHQRRRRLARPSDAGAARRLHRARGARPHRRPRRRAHRRSSATSSHSRVARSDVEVFTMLGADVTLVAPRDAAAAGGRRRPPPPISTPSIGEGRRALPAADAAGADDRGRSCRASASTATRFGLTAERARAPPRARAR